MVLVMVRVMVRVPGALWWRYWTCTWVHRHAVYVSYVKKATDSEFGVLLMIKLVFKEEKNHFMVKMQISTNFIRLKCKKF